MPSHQTFNYSHILPWPDYWIASTRAYTQTYANTHLPAISCRIITRYCPWLPIITHQSPATTDREPITTRLASPFVSCIGGYDAPVSSVQQPISTQPSRHDTSLPKLQRAAQSLFQSLPGFSVIMAGARWRGNCHRRQKIQLYPLPFHQSVFTQAAPHHTSRTHTTRNGRAISRVKTPLPGRHRSALWLRPQLAGRSPSLPPSPPHHRRGDVSISGELARGVRWPVPARTERAAEGGDIGEADRGCREWEPYRELENNQSNECSALISLPLLSFLPVLEATRTLAVSWNIYLLSEYQTGLSETLNFTNILRKLAYHLALSEEM